MKAHYGLFGFPLGHSFSAQYFAEKFQREQREAVYQNYEIASVNEVMACVKQASLLGFNVTIPYKQAILPLLDSVSQEAAAIGAVNVVCVERKAGTIRLHGHNSDIIGFEQSLRPLLQPQHTHALVLGTGGASRAVVYALQRLGIEVQLVSRKASPTAYSYEQLTPALLQQYTLIVNCTPLGTFPKVDTCPPLPYEALTEAHLLYDLVYNPAETRFLLQGKAQGATIKNGYEMLVLQAEAAWNIWQQQP